MSPSRAKKSEPRCHFFGKLFVIELTGIIDSITLYYLRGEIMPRKQLKFVIGPVIVVLVLVWIATSALNSTLAYFQTVSEVYAMETAGELEGKRLRVMGEVVPGTIVRTDEAVKFTIVDLETHQTMDIEYIGNSPVPDTLRDYSEAVVDGSYVGNGVFTGTTLQAKCASKYERELEAGVITQATELNPEGF